VADPFYAYPNPIIQPAMRIINTIGQGEITTITTSFAHLYKTGLIVRIVIPRYFGMPEINNLYAPITVISPTEFTMPINSIGFAPLTVPTSAIEYRSVPQCIPMAEINSQLDQAEHNIYG